MAFVLYKGIEWRRRLTVTDSETGARTDLTGRTVTVQVRRRSGEPALISLGVGTGVTLLTQSGETKGQADVVIADSLSVGLEVATHQINVLLDGQIVLAPLKLPVRAL